MKNFVIAVIIFVALLLGGLIGYLLHFSISLNKLTEKEKTYQTQIAQKDQTIQTLQKNLDDAVTDKKSIQEQFSRLEYENSQKTQKTVGNDTKELKTSNQPTPEAIVGRKSGQSTKPGNYIKSDMFNRFELEMWFFRQKCG